MALPEGKRPREVYHSLTHYRRNFLEYAEDAAKLTDPSLNPKGESKLDRPYTHLGTQGLRTLASTVHRVMMPPQVKYIRLLPRQMTTGVDPDVRAETDEIASGIENDVLRFLAVRGVRSQVASAFRRNLVEGSTAWWLQDKMLRFYPLRSHVVVRESSKPLLLVCREQDIVDKYSMPAEETIGKEDDLDWIYTLVDFEDHMVYQEKTADDTLIELGEESWRFGLMVGSVPDIDDYPTSYVWDHLGLIQQLDNAGQSLAEAMANASWVFPLISPGSTVTPQDLWAHRAGIPMIASRDDFSWFNADIKLSNWDQIIMLRNQLRDEMSGLFALGLKDRTKYANTATEVLQLATELDQHTQDLLAAYEDTFLLPLVEASLRVLSDGKSDIDEDGKIKGVEVVVTTGQNALQRETALSRLVNTASVVKGSLDPTLGVDGVALMRRAAAAQQFEMGKIFYQTQQAQPGQGQQVSESASAAAPQPRQPRQPTNPQPGV